MENAMIFDSLFVFLVEDQELEQRLEQGGRDNEAGETGGRGRTKRVSSTKHI